MKEDFLIDKNNISPYKKILLLILHIRNWYLILFDKLGLLSSIVYTTRKGLIFVCRGKSTDINEVVAVASGIEYPAKYISLKKNDVVIDLGANIGSFTVYVDSVNRKVGYKGYAFEPFDKNLELLKANCRYNNVKKFTLLQNAVSGKNGTVYMDIDCNPDSVSVLKDKKGTIPIASVKLSTFCKKNNIKEVSLIKMDIEGSEYELIEEDLEFISKHVKRVILEYHNLDSKYNKKWIEKKLAPFFDFTPVYDAEVYGVFYAQNKAN